MEVRRTGVRLPQVDRTANAHLSSFEIQRTVATRAGCEGGSMGSERAPPKARAESDGIAAAFTEFRSALTRLVARIVGPNSIEDIVQETFIRSYEASRRQTINHPRSFMWKTAKNLALNHIQNANNKLTTNVADFGDPDVYLPTEVVEAEMEFESRERFWCSAGPSSDYHCSVGESLY
jgi:hypothetical protein